MCGYNGIDKYEIKMWELAGKDLCFWADMDACYACFEEHAFECNENFKTSQEALIDL